MVAATGLAVHRKFTRSESYKQTHKFVLDSSIESASLIGPKKFAAGTWEGDIKCFEDGNESKAKQAGPVRSIARLDDKLFATSDRGVVRIWNSETMQQERVLCDEKSRDVEKMAGFPNGLIAVVRSVNRLQVWDAHTGTLKHQLSGNSHWIKSIVARPNNRLAVSTFDQNVHIWNVDTGECERIFKSRFAGPARSLDDTLVTVDWQGLAVWTHGHLMKEVDLPNLPWYPLHAVTADGKVLVTTETREFYLVDVATGQTTTVGSEQDAKYDCDGWQQLDQNVFTKNSKLKMCVEAFFFLLDVC